MRNFENFNIGNLPMEVSLGKGFLFSVAHFGASSFVFALFHFCIFYSLEMNAQTDTLENYNKWRGGVFYQSPQIIKQAARFDLLQPSLIKQISLTLTSKSREGSALVHIYGHEGGIMAPYLEKDLIEPIQINKSKAGIEKIDIVLNKKIMIENNQFFIAVDNLSPGVNVLSDNEEKYPSCVSEKGGVYYYQLLKNADNSWVYGKYGYAITVIVEYLDEPKEAIFEDITKDCKVKDTLFKNKNMALSDVNKDGFIDLLVDGALYKNNGDETFSNINALSEIKGSPLANLFIDINCDGKTDILFLGCEKDSSFSTNRLYINNGEGKFIYEPLLLPEISAPTGYSIADINGDYYPDIFISQGEDTNGTALPNYLLVNDLRKGFYNFSSLIYEIGKNNRNSSSSGFVDYDNDGDMDLFVVNKYGGNDLWDNQGNLEFKNSSEKLLPRENPEIDTLENLSSFGGGLDWADFDGDGFVDLLMPERSVIYGQTQSTLAGTKIYRNQGKPEYRFKEEYDLYNIELEEEQSGGCWGDINNDGLQDLILTSACPCRFADLYIQESVKNFRNKTHYSGFDRRTLGEDAVFVDINNDGKLDIITNEGQFLRVFKNNESDNNNNYIDIDFENINGSSPVGSKVEVHTGEKIYRQVLSSGNGLLVQKPLKLHFGLGEENVDSVVVFGPSNPDKGVTYTNFTANKTNKVEKINLEKPKTNIELFAFPNPFENETGINYYLNESGQVKLSIYTLDGGKIIELVNEYQKSGQCKMIWNGKNELGIAVGSGAYIYRLNVGGKEISGRIIKTN